MHQHVGSEIWLYLYGFTHEELQVQNSEYSSPYPGLFEKHSEQREDPARSACSSHTLRPTL